MIDDDWCGHATCHGYRVKGKDKDKGWGTVSMRQATMEAAVAAAAAVGRRRAVHCCCCSRCSVALARAPLCLAAVLLPALQSSPARWQPWRAWSKSRAIHQCIGPMSSVRVRVRMMAPEWAADLLPLPPMLPLHRRAPRRLRPCIALSSGRALV